MGRCVTNPTKQALCLVNTLISLGLTPSLVRTVVVLVMVAKGLFFLDDDIEE